MKKKTAALIVAAAFLSACGNNPSLSDSELIDDIYDDSADILIDDNDVIILEDEPVQTTESKSESDETETNASAAAEEIPAETESTEEEETLPENMLEYLTDKNLKNTTVKWFSYYNPWEKDTSNSEPFSVYAAELFEETYGGKIEWYPTTWDMRFSDLSVMILGGQGMDIIPDSDMFPRCCTNGSIQSYDKYIDWENPIWKSVKNLNDDYKIGENHYLIVCGAEAENVVYYNKKTIEENGLDDPWELYLDGGWTMENFMYMLEFFVDEENGRYGLDGWFNEEALYLACGTAPISFRNGRLSDNFSDANFERAMNYQYEMFSRGLVADKSLFNYASQEQFIGEGKELFYICGMWRIFGEQEVWTDILGDAEDVAFVPIPRDEKADKYYQSVSLKGFGLCNGAKNPEGAARLMECMTAVCNDAEINSSINMDYKNQYGWSDEILERREEIQRLARKNPVSSVCSGLPADAYSIMNEAVSKPFNGEDWQSAKEWADGLDLIIDDINTAFDELK